MVQKIFSVGVLLLISASGSLSSGMIREGCKAFVNYHESTAYVKVGDRMFQGKTKCSDAHAFGSLANKTLVRLVGGESFMEGRVEVLHEGEWGTVCNHEWGKGDASVVCRMLGYHDASSAPKDAKFGEGNGRIWLDNVDCKAGEDDISHCGHRGWGVHNCDHGDDASAVCNPIEGDERIRLVNGYGGPQGRVEILENREWSAICDDYWDVKDAEVVCRMLGYNAAKSAPGRAYFGEGNIEMLQRAYHCQGNESDIGECDTTETNFTCQHSECASVICHDNKSAAACGERDCSGLCKFVEVEGKPAIECYRVSREGTCSETLPETFVNITDPCKDKEETRYAGSTSSMTTTSDMNERYSEFAPSTGGAPSWLGWVVGIVIGVIFGILIGYFVMKIFRRKSQHPSTENAYESDHGHPHGLRQTRDEEGLYQVAGEVSPAGGGNGHQDVQPQQEITPPKGEEEQYGMKENVLYGMH